MSALRRGAALRFEAMLAATLAAAAETHGAEPFGLCVVDLADPDGRRLAVALYAASPHGPDPARLTEQRPGLWWGRSAVLAVLAPVVASVLGADLGATVEAVSAARAVPVVHVAAGVASVGAFARPDRSS